jgi:hypothetical protein
LICRQYYCACIEESITILWLFVSARFNMRDKQS